MGMESIRRSFAAPEYPFLNNYRAHQFPALDAALPEILCYILFTLWVNHILSYNVPFAIPKGSYFDRHFQDQAAGALLQGISEGH
jgi:hypothetical protein